jgi:transaldolase
MAPNANLQRLHDAGVSIWLDTLSRQLLEGGEFATLIRDCSVTGATSNPTIFAKAITGSDRYDNQLQQLAGRGVSDPQELFFALTLEDVRSAAGQLRAAYDASEGRDGFVSFECTPDLANDADATIAQGLDLWACLDQPNVMIKVPGTQAGLVAIRELTRRGVNVNVTLLFSVERYEAVLDAYLAGLHDRVQAGESVDGIASAASFFLSRVDSKVDNQLPATSPLRGQIAIASARVAYQRYLARFDGPAWRGLVERGARTQRPLWASTGTKDPAYSDVRYVAQLIGPDVINTMPRPTLEAFADHGEAARTVDVAPDDAQQTLDDLATAGVDLTAITQQLEREGVAAFCDSYRALLDCIERQLARPRSTRADALSRRAAARRAPRPGCAPGRARRRGS